MKEIELNAAHGYIGMATHKKDGTYIYFHVNKGYATSMLDNTFEMRQFLHEALERMEKEAKKANDLHG